jgi:hypothetical protein
VRRYIAFRWTEQNGVLWLSSFAGPQTAKRAMMDRRRKLDGQRFGLAA